MILDTAVEEQHRIDVMILKIRKNLIHQEENQLL